MRSRTWNRLRHWHWGKLASRIGSVLKFGRGVALIEQAPGLVVRVEQRLDRIEQARIIRTGLGEKGGALRRGTFERGVEESFDLFQPVGGIHNLIVYPRAVRQSSPHNQPRAPVCLVICADLGDGVVMQPGAFQ